VLLVQHLLGTMLLIYYMQLQVGAQFNTPVLTATTKYYVAQKLTVVEVNLQQGYCSVNPLPATPATNCDTNALYVKVLL
jgi:hypothetical protein